MTTKKEKILRMTKQNSVSVTRYYWPGLASILLFTLITVACSHSQEEPLESMAPYQYPKDEIGTGKTFIYRKLGGKEQINVILKVIEKEGVEYFVNVMGNEQVMFDSTIYSMDDPAKFLEIYRYEYDSLNNFEGLTKASVAEEEYFSNGTPYGGRKLEIVFEAGNIKSTIEAAENFVKDTVYYWNGTERQALYFEHKTKLSISHSNSPVSRELLNYTGYTIFAKGPGIVKYGENIDGELSEYELITIR